MSIQQILVESTYGASLWGMYIMMSAVGGGKGVPKKQM